MSSRKNFLHAVKWNEQGLVAAIAQSAESGRVLMMAWMNRAALQATVDSGRAVYFSRSRQQLWRKGEESGHYQSVQKISLDCDGDVVLLTVEQHGDIACHTGRESCFYRVYNAGEWQTVDAVVKDPAEIYNKSS